MPERDDLADVMALLPELGESVIDSSPESPLTRIYILLLTTRQPSREVLHEAGFAPDTIDAALRVLARRGFLAVGSDGRIHLESPDTAMREVAHHLERQAAMTRRALPDLLRLYHETRQPSAIGDDQRIRLLVSLQDIHGATESLVTSATTRVCAMRAPTHGVAAMLTDSLAPPTSPGVRTDVLYDARLLEDPATSEPIRARAHVENQRVTSDLPFTAIIVDGSSAVIDVSLPGRSAPHGLMLHTPHIVDPLRWIIERFWSLGAPLTRERGSHPLDRRDELILSLLATGASDATIARQAKVSQRTVERRVRALLDELGAQSRFQAGVLASRRGWV